MPEKNEEENKEIALAVFEAFESLDRNAIIQIIHDDCYYRNMPFPAFTAARDKNQLIKQVDLMLRLMSCYRVAEYLKVSVKGSEVIVDRIEHVGMFGVKMALHVKAVIEINDGKVIKWLDYFSIKETASAFFKGIFKPAF